MIIELYLDDGFIHSFLPSVGVNNSVNIVQYNIIFKSLDLDLSLLEYNIII
jgi:hypothetical protein